MTRLTEEIPGLELIEEWKQTIHDLSMKAVVKLNDPRVLRSRTYARYFIDQIKSEGSLRKYYRPSCPPLLEETRVHHAQVDISVVVLFYSGYNFNEHPLPAGSNYAVWAIMMNGDEDQCAETYRFLDRLFLEYHYQAGVLINVGKRDHCLQEYAGDYADRLVGIAVEAAAKGYIARSAYISNGKYIGWPA
jgi:hypothetical protein